MARGRVGGGAVAAPVAPERPHATVPGTVSGLIGRVWFRIAEAKPARTVSSVRGSTSVMVVRSVPFGPSCFSTMSVVPASSAPSFSAFAVLTTYALRNESSSRYACGDAFPRFEISCICADMRNSS
jgi:hypothetical protein